tara:strand:- start:1520 stop:1690 length:171 start_codon:yes stop_codon:yes gene_type:complete
MKKCVICNRPMHEDFGKIDGAMIKVKNELGKKQFIRVCSDCQKQENWIEKAKIKGA